MRKLIAFVFAFMFFSSFVATAVETIQPFASNYLDAYSISAIPQGGGKILVEATVNAVHPKMTKIGFSIISLYEMNNNSWTLVETVSSQYTSNAGSHRYQFTYKGTVGKSYYAAASFIAEDATGSDYRTANSVTKVAT